MMLKFVLTYSGLGLLSSTVLRTKYWNFFFLLWYFPILDSVYSLRGPSTKFLTPWEDAFLEQLLHLLPGVACIHLTEGTREQLKFPWPPLFRVPTVIQHVLWTSPCSYDRTQFAVPSTGIDPVCSFRLGMILAEVPVNCSPEQGDECECKSDHWHRVLLPVLCCTATRLLQLQNTSDPWYKARHAHKRLYTVLPKYSKIQVLPGITSCRLVKDNKQAIELNSLLLNNMLKDGYEWN